MARPPTAGPPILGADGPAGAQRVGSSAVTTICSDLGYFAERRWPIRRARRVLRVVAAAGAEHDPGQLVLLGQQPIQCCSKVRVAHCQGAIAVRAALGADEVQEGRRARSSMLRDDFDMTSPYLLVQLSDPHIGADWAEGDPVEGLAAAVESVRAMGIRPDALLVTGDLADGATDPEYERVRGLLAPLRAPAYVLPGNHDDRSTLRSHFGLPGANAEPVCYRVDLGPLGLVVLDATIPGEDSGALDREQLKWLERVLEASPEQPTLMAMHHPPLRTGVPAWDEIGLSETSRQSLAEVVERHPQVRRIVAGHVHRTISGELGGRSVLTVPSTYVQGRLKFGSRELELATEPAGFAVHAVLDGSLVSHIQPVV